jgi:hypothetical protein
MRFSSIEVVLATIAMTPFIGCNLITPRKSQLDGVRRAALKIESRIATGINQLEYPQVVSELAYELLLARDLPLDAFDVEAAKKYQQVLETYMAAKDVWDANQKYQDCLRSSSTERFCRDTYGSSAGRAAAKAQVSIEVVYGVDAVQTVWQLAEKEVAEAERIRAGGFPNALKESPKKN